jgi:hypothetical protein
MRASDLPDPSEHALQAQVLQLIVTGKSHPDIFAFAIPNAARRSFKLAMKMKSEGLMSGVADICIMMQEARTAWLEMKKRGGRQETSQKGFAARCARLGHPYGIAYSVDEAADFLRQIGVLR